MVSTVKVCWTCLTLNRPNEKMTALCRAMTEKTATADNQSTLYCLSILAGATVVCSGVAVYSSSLGHLLLQSQGYHILPVNPRGGALFGEHMFRSLAEIDVSVDVVEVFRPTQEAPEIARQAVAVGAKVLWLQVGIVSEEARQIAEAAGLTVVMYRSMGATHGLLGLGPGPHASTVV